MKDVNELVKNLAVLNIPKAYLERIVEIEIERKRLADLVETAVPIIQEVIRSTPEHCTCDDYDTRGIFSPLCAYCEGDDEKHQTAVAWVNAYQKGGRQ